MDDDPTAARTPPSEPNPALAALDVLVGKWEMVLSNAAFLPPEIGQVKGSVACDWVQDGAFLAMQMRGSPSGTPAALWLISRDDAASEYTVLYYDDRRVSRVYSMSFDDRVWKLWRDASGFRQRFEGAVSEDGGTISAHWEKSTDGTTWEHDFDVTYTKLA